MTIRPGDSRTPGPRSTQSPANPPRPFSRGFPPRPGSTPRPGLARPGFPFRATGSTPPGAAGTPPATPGPFPGSGPARPWPPTQPAEAPPRRRITRAELVRWSTRLGVALLVLTLVIPVLYRVATPPRTLFMLTDEVDGPIVYQNVSLDYISRHYVAAVIVHEDAKLGSRTGPYHLGEFVDRATTFMATGDDLSGSTIPQQLVKNIFLVRGESAIGKLTRKGVEAVVAWPFNLIGDRRQLELYLNYAQFGPNLYGICAASWYYFNRPPWEGNTWDAATLAGLLPLGEDAKRAPGGGVDITSDGQWVVASTVTRARDRVPQRIAEMGGWEGTVGTVGILDSATDNNPHDDPDSCGSMPQSVADRLAAEGAWWS